MNDKPDKWILIARNDRMVIVVEQKWYKPPGVIYQCKTGKINGQPQNQSNKGNFGESNLEHQNNT